MADPTAVTTESLELIRAGAALTQPHLVDGHAYAVLPAGYAIHDLEYLQEQPSRQKGTIHAHESDSFIRLVQRYQSEAAIVYADLGRGVITAVLNDTTENGVDAGHRDWRISYVPPVSDAWKRWTAANGKRMSQVQFAEFIEQNLINIYEPSSADVLELATSLSVDSTVKWSSATRLQSGNRQLQYVEESTARGGKTGVLTVPSHFVLGMPVYQGSDAIVIKALFRYRLTNGELIMWIDLEQTEEAVQVAFSELVTTIDAGIDAPVVYGVP